MMPGMGTVHRIYDEPDEPEGEGTAATGEWPEIHARALERFERATEGQLEVRAHALMCRRFISIPGAMWEGAWGEQFANSIKVEIDKISKGVDKIVTDYRQNRIVPDFRPAGTGADASTANTLDGIHRADNYNFKSQQSRDNAFEEAVLGGFGAYRLCSDYAVPEDKDNDGIRVNPGALIADADQRVFFDPNSKLYDKSDADFAFVLTAEARASFEEDYPGRVSDWPENKIVGNYDWFAPEIVVKAEYYEVEEVSETLYIFTQKLTGDQQRFWASELENTERDELLQQGWSKSSQRRERKRIHKYCMSGAEILEDSGLILGPNIPIVPVYGRRWFVENQERFRGHVSKLMDAQRIYNGRVSKLSETDALSPREKPIFLAEQMPPHLRELWSKQEQERHPYALVNPVIDPVTGQIVQLGPIGMIGPPTLNQVTALLLQIASGDLADETQDGAEKVVANTSAEAMDIAATRVDAKSGIFLDNMRQSVQREGEIYLGMAPEAYFEEGRTLETMSEDGEDGQATIKEPFTDKAGNFLYRNDFGSGRYKCIVDVTEATSTRRDKAVKSALRTAEIAITAQDMEMAQAAIIVAVMNQDGEGMDELQKFARKKGVAMGVIEPNEQEKAEMTAEQMKQQQQPDPMAVVAGAQAQALGAQAQKDMASAGKIEADTALSKAKTIDTLANAGKKRAETRLVTHGPPPAPPSITGGGPPTESPL